MSAYRPKAVIVLVRPSSPRLAISGNSRSDKTFIGRIRRGSDFLRYRFGPEGLSVAKNTV